MRGKRKIEKNKNINWRQRIKGIEINKRIEEEEKRKEEVKFKVEKQ
jgi:hypothetical protein